MRVGDVVKIKENSYYGGKEGIIIFIEVVRVIKAGKRYEYGVVRFNDGSIEEFKEHELKYVKHRKLSKHEQNLHDEYLQEEQDAERQQEEFEVSMKKLFRNVVIFVAIALVAWGYFQ